MRRNDREITDRGRIFEIMAACDCLRLGIRDGDSVSVVPLSFGEAVEDGQTVLYFHGAREGRKLDLLSAHPSVGFEMDRAIQLKPATTACGFSTSYQSLMGQGEVTPVTDRDAKRRGLTAIMRHYTGRKEWDFEDSQLDAVCVMKLTVHSLTGKERA